MSRRSILAGLATVVAATALTTPAANAQEIIAPPPPPVSPANPQPAPSAQISFGNCAVHESTHGYAYASCTISAAFVPAGQTVSASYKASLPTFKPRTKVNWRDQAGTLTLTNTGANTGTVNGVVKLAFKGKSAEQVRRSLILAATGSSNAELIQPIATVHG